MNFKQWLTGSSGPGRRQRRALTECMKWQKLLEHELTDRRVCVRAM